MLKKAKWRNEIKNVTINHSWDIRSQDLTAQTLTAIFKKNCNDSKIFIRLTLRRLGWDVTFLGLLQESCFQALFFRGYSVPLNPVSLSTSSLNRSKSFFICYIMLTMSISCCTRLGCAAGSPVKAAFVVAVAFSMYSGWRGSFIQESYWWLFYTQKITVKSMQDDKEKLSDQFFDKFLAFVSSKLP